MNQFKDPVCGMQVTPQSAVATTVYQGETYYFCSLGCQQTFETRPEQYVSQPHPAHAHGCC